MDQISLATVASIAFIGSFGHCIGMCGGFVMAYSTSKFSRNHSKYYHFLCHLFYNFGRVFSYVILGIIFGLIGSIFSISVIAKGYLFFILGIFMVLVGLSIMGKINFLIYIENFLPSTKIFQNYFLRLKSQNSLINYLTLGMLNGFLPCGFVYYFAIFAIASTSWFWGGVTMLVFGISTIPAMLGFGYVVGFLNNSKFRDIMVKITSFIVILYGIYLSYIGFMATV